MSKDGVHKKGQGETPKPCPIYGKRFCTQLVRHIAKVHPSVYKKYGREVVEKCSRGVTSLVSKGITRYPEHFILSAFGQAWRDPPEEVRESLACLGVEVILSGISLPEACGVEVERDFDGNADIGRTEEVEVSPPSALLEVEAQNIPDNSEATEETALPVDRVEVPGQEADGGKSGYINDLIIFFESEELSLPATPDIFQPPPTPRERWDIRRGRRVVCNAYSASIM
ncbi:uncharacterized protein LOC124170407 [Ischnura elegans]|uniref:uncharacterized protein LOC124170407 n=1 Tax=Ischnura elegans TaxID=197161 RepID=UPI001ED895C3|nr:uncharacterized protein LOC124170407 [Ischnura elegans]